MLYYLVRPIARVGILLFYRRLYLLNRQRIPRQGPVILAVNHPTAFMEPCIMACFLPRALHFLVRGNLYKNPTLEKVLRALHMLPIYRTEDGSFSERRRNVSIFRECYRALGEGRVIMILSEGRTILEKRLRPLRKGNARLTFGTLDAHAGLPLQLIPIGVTFTKGEEPRSEVLISVGDAIPIQDLYTIYTQDPNEATSQLLDRIAAGLQSQMVLIPDPADEPLSESMLQYYRHDLRLPIWPVVRTDPQRWVDEKAICAAVDQLSPTERHAWWSKVESYQVLLERYGLSDRDVVVRPGWAKILLWCVTWPLFLVCLTVHLLPLSLGRYLADSRVSAVEFYAPVLCTIYIILFIILQGALLVAAAFVGGWLWGVALLYIPGLYLCILHSETSRQVVNRLRYLGQPKALRHRMQHQRQQIRQFYQSV